jgi:hypothetical protein
MILSFGMDVPCARSAVSFYKLAACSAWCACHARLAMLKVCCCRCFWLPLYDSHHIVRWQVTPRLVPPSPKALWLHDRCAASPHAIPQVRVQQLCQHGQELPVTHRRQQPCRPAVQCVYAGKPYMHLPGESDTLYQHPQHKLFMIIANRAALYNAAACCSSSALPA